MNGVNGATKPTRGEYVCALQTICAPTRRTRQTGADLKKKRAETNMKSAYNANRCVGEDLGRRDTDTRRCGSGWNWLCYRIDDHEPLPTRTPAAMPRRSLDPGPGPGPPGPPYISQKLFGIVTLAPRYIPEAILLMNCSFAGVSSSCSCRLDL